MPLYLPAQRPPTSVVTSVGSARHSVGYLLSANNAGGPASAAWPAANQAIYIPFYIEEPTIVAQLWVFNGATANGNVDMGLFDAAFAKLVSSGATAQSGTNAAQAFDITDALLPRGVYYLGISLSSGTGTTQRYSTNPVIGMHRGFGITQEASAHPLPSTMTPAAVTTAYIPMCGIATRALL